MSTNDVQSPDEPLGNEVFSQSDDALDEDFRLDPDFIEELEQDPSLDPALQLDVRELTEAGVQLDDPEKIVTLDGGIDDPDGLGDPSDPKLDRSDDDQGWDLDAPVTAGDETDPELLD